MKQLANIKNTIIFFVCPSRRVVGVRVSFFLKFLCFNFCRYSPVMLYPNVRYFSFIYGGNLSKTLKNLRKV